MPRFFAFYIFTIASVQLRSLISIAKNYTIDERVTDAWSKFDFQNMKKKEICNLELSFLNISSENNLNKLGQGTCLKRI